MIHDQLYVDFLRQLTEARRLMFSELMEKKAAGDDDGAKSILDSACRREIGIPIDVVRRTSPERLLDLIRHGGNPNLNSILIAELLLQDVELNEKTGNGSQAMVSRLQAFCLLVDSIDLLRSKEQVEYRKRLNLIASELKSISGDPYVHRKVDEYLSTRHDA